VRACVCVRARACVCVCVCVVGGWVLCVYPFLRVQVNRSVLLNQYVPQVSFSTINM
jgi:hypothetical protein